MVAHGGACCGHPPSIGILGELIMSVTAFLTRFRQPMPASSATTSFHRRLIGLCLLMLAALVMLGAQVIRLTVVEGENRLARAEAHLAQTSYLPTIRGTIFDRYGRELAV